MSLDGNSAVRQLCFPSQGDYDLRVEDGLRQDCFDTYENQVAADGIQFYQGFAGVEGPKKRGNLTSARAEESKKAGKFTG